MTSALAACAAVLLISFELPGCTPQYWVPGLTLPPGSAVTSRTESTTSGNGFPGLPSAIPFMGTPEKMLMVQFTNPAGWSVVSAHVDSCMKAQGYADMFSSLGSFMGAATPPGSSAMMSSMRSYTKSGSKYMVMLEDMGGLMGAVAQARNTPSIPGMSGFSMTVMRMK